MPHDLFVYPRFSGAISSERYSNISHKPVHLFIWIDGGSKVIHAETSKLWLREPVSNNLYNSILEEL